MIKRKPTSEEQTDAYQIISSYKHKSANEKDQKNFVYSLTENHNL